MNLVLSFVGILIKNTHLCVCVCVCVCVYQYKHTHARMHTNARTYAHAHTKILYNITSLSANCELQVNFAIPFEHHL